MTKYQNLFPDVPAHRGRLLDARLHLLDRQLQASDGEPVGIVDDLELDLDPDDLGFGDGAAPQVTAILTGQVLLTRIFGGRPPRSRLQALPWQFVAKLGTVLRLSPNTGELDHLWVEHWLRDHLIGRIPGGRHAAE